MNVLINLISLCLLFGISTAKPVNDLLGDSENELVLASSLSKKVQSQPIEDLASAATHHGGGQQHHDDDDNGYYKSKSTKGDNGYKHFDSYHKKGGDNYGYEKHSAFGYGKGDKDGGSYHTSGKYEEADGDEGGSHGEYHDGEGTEESYRKVKKVKPQKEQKAAATDGDYYYSNYESEGEGGDDSGHFEEGGDEGHYEEGGDGGHYSEGYEEGPSSGYYDASSEGEGEGESEGYYDEGETRNKKVIHHGPSGATSYFVRHD